jgi:tetratricopeptide (TPR) repeat protein
MVALAPSGGQARAQEPAQAPAPPQAQAQPAADTAYSAAGLYNLANSYARAGKPGMAVLNYERAALLAPNDADIQANLNQVRASVHLPPQAGSRFGQIVRLASPDVVAWIGVLGIVIIGASLSWATVSRRFRALRFTALVLGIAALAFTAGNALLQWPKLREAVVIVKETPVRVSPVPMGDPLLQLTEAETVTITAQHEDFVLVHTRNGRDGWAARADLADVVPDHSVR